MSGGTASDIAFVVGVRPEKREEYLELHRAVWPEVEAKLTRVQHPQLQHLRLRRHPVRLLRVRRRRSRGGHAADRATIRCRRSGGRTPTRARCGSRRNAIPGRSGSRSTKCGTCGDRAHRRARAPLEPRHRPAGLDRPGHDGGHRPRLRTPDDLGAHARGRPAWTAPSSCRRATASTRASGSRAVDPAAVAGLVGVGRPERRTSPPQLDQVRAGATVPVVGVRHLAHIDPDPEWLLRPRRRSAGLAALGRGGPRVRPGRPRLAAAAGRDVLPRHPHDSRSCSTTWAGRSPTTRTPSRWETGSGARGASERRREALGPHARARRRERGARRPAPVVATAFDAFGPDRLLYGSDWPLAELGGGRARVARGGRRLLCAELARATGTTVLGGDALLRSTRSTEARRPRPRARAHGRAAGAAPTRRGCGRASPSRRRRRRRARSRRRWRRARRASARPRPAD